MKSPWLFLVAVAALACSRGDAQVSQTGVPKQSATPAPSTKLEAFAPKAGSVMTMGYDDLGSVQGVSVDAREVADAKRGSVRGLVVEIRQSDYNTERSFVDADEVPELLKGIDAILAVKDNPTQFKSFEVSYSTRDDLTVTAFNDVEGKISYALKAGGISGARRFLSAADLQQFRGFIDAARAKLGQVR